MTQGVGEAWPWREGQWVGGSGGGVSAEGEDMCNNSVPYLL